MKFITLALVLISFQSMGGTLSFKCDLSDITFINQFSLEARDIEVENNRFTNAHFDFLLRKAGRNSSIDSLAVSRDGIVQVFEPGTMYRDQIIRVFSVQKGAEIEYINLLLDVPEKHLSQIRFADGMTYYGSCKSF